MNIFIQHFCLHIKFQIFLFSIGKRCTREKQMVYLCSLSLCVYIRCFVVAYCLQRINIQIWYFLNNVHPDMIFLAYVLFRIHLWHHIEEHSIVLLKCFLGGRYQYNTSKETPLNNISDALLPLHFLLNCIPSPFDVVSVRLESLRMYFAPSLVNAYWLVETNIHTIYIELWTKHSIK